ncbi:Uncharacterized protein TCM_005759 [Theobroma cacao]|uniref:RNase H type-1 domain-containing protein n=1 Tax=Theobroma cacao TaxID=3641 RepID=A0A061DUX4_THECC|nr:Uncharacterized protein TCM_005759 [Theobroma cacao]
MIKGFKGSSSLYSVFGSFLFRGLRDRDYFVTLLIDEVILLVYVRSGEPVCSCLFCQAGFHFMPMRVSGSSSSRLSMVLQGRLAVKELLVSRGILKSEAAICLICRSEIESVGHLFFNCSETWRVWQKWCALWKTEWVSYSKLEIWFQRWNNAASCFENGLVWRMAFYAITLSIWITRNDMVFKGKSWDSSQVSELVIVRIAWWMHAKWPEVNLGVDDLIKDPCNATNPRRVSHAGIGSILKDWSGDVMALFSKSMGMIDSNLEELLAVKEAAVIFAASTWRSSVKLMIECDSSNVVKWVRNPSVVPWRLRKEIIFIHNMLTRIDEWQIGHILRSANGDADTLAKGGVQRA